MLYLHASSAPGIDLRLGTDRAWRQKGLPKGTSSKAESRGCWEADSRTDGQWSTAEVGCGPPVLFSAPSPTSVIRFFTALSSKQKLYSMSLSLWVGLFPTLKPRQKAHPHLFLSGACCCDSNLGSELHASSPAAPTPPLYLWSRSLPLHPALHCSLQSLPVLPSESLPRLELAPHRAPSSPSAPLGDPELDPLQSSTPLSMKLLHPQSSGNVEGLAVSGLGEEGIRDWKGSGKQNPGSTSTKIIVTHHCRFQRTLRFGLKGG